LITAGLDIGSRTIALVVLEEREIVSSEVRDASFEPLRQCRDLLAGRKFDKLIATGYGRHAAMEHFADSVITEIKAFALGCRFLIPGCRTILDVGGQDTKAILLSEDGRVADFQMNDRCAAGTGRFLEIMAQTLGYEIDEFWKAALKAKDSVEISSMCTVFAESEVVGLISRKVPKYEIARGLHQSICERSTSLLKRVVIERELVFAGGGAKNKCLQRLMEENLGIPILVPENPQAAGALGAALSAVDDKFV
jgi:(R)-2-hydroxyacyl-CoA dehydratese activating ATPase